jgi:hypothetical protein
LFMFGKESATGGGYSEHARGGVRVGHGVRGGFAGNGGERRDGRARSIIRRRTLVHVHGGEFIYISVFNSRAGD